MAVLTLNSQFASIYGAVGGDGPVASVTLVSDLSQFMSGTYRL
jgi:hypothetical protein